MKTFKDVHAYYCTQHISGTNGSLPEYLTRLGLDASLVTNILRLGVSVGSVMSKNQVLTKHTDIVTYLNKRISNRAVAKIVDKGVSTVKRVRKILKDEGMLPA